MDALASHVFPLIIKTASSRQQRRLIPSLSLVTQTAGLCEGLQKKALYCLSGDISSSFHLHSAIAVSNRQTRWGLLIFNNKWLL